MIVRTFPVSAEQWSRVNGDRISKAKLIADLHQQIWNKILLEIGMDKSYNNCKPTQMPKYQNKKCPINSFFIMFAQVKLVKVFTLS